MDRAPLTWEPAETITVALKPMAASQKYSKVVKVMAKSARIGADVMRMTAPSKPPRPKRRRPLPEPALLFPAS